MKKITIIGSTFATILTIASLAVPTFAASNPADNASSYSYSTGRQAYESRMAEDHAWYDNEDDSVNADYSFNIGSETAKSRINTFSNMPAGDDISKEDIEAWFGSNTIGENSAWSNGQYDESAIGSYGYAKGQAAYQQRHAAFSSNN